MRLVSVLLLCPSWVLAGSGRSVVQDHGTADGGQPERQMNYNQDSVRQALQAGRPANVD